MVILACEFRQRVHDQLRKLAPGEFKPKLIAPAGGRRPRRRRTCSRDGRRVAKDRLNVEAVIGAVTGLGVRSSAARKSAAT